jgi:hypothetical protein
LQFDLSPPGSAEFGTKVLCAILCWPVIDPLGR